MANGYKSRATRPVAVDGQDTPGTVTTAIKANALPAGTRPLDELADCVAQEVEAAIRFCTKTVAVLDTPRLWNKQFFRYTDRYFTLEDETAVKTNLSVLRETICLIRRGLSGDVLVKVVHLGDPKPDEGGYVKTGPEPKQHNRDQHERVGYGTKIGKGGKQPISPGRFSGAIHVAEAFINFNVNEVQALLHEASHRYAGTHDSDGEGYFYEEGQGSFSDAADSAFSSQGIASSNRKRAQLAIHNADSYGWFICKIARQFRNTTLSTI